MSWQATAWVATVEAGGSSGKLLLYALANYADEHGRCWPSDARLMQDTELSERAIREWKRKLEEAGLLRVERRRTPGGTFQADEIRLSMGAQPPAKSAGGATGKSCRDHRQMTPPPPADGAVPPTPPYIAEPSEEPPIEPVEREARASERQEGQPEAQAPAADERPSRQALERRFWKLAKNHPQSAGMPKQAWLVEWLKLSPEEQDRAEERYSGWLALLKRQGKSHVPALSTYFAQRLFEEVEEPAEEKPAALEAAPFGKIWQAARLKQLVLGPTAPRPALTAFQRRMIEDGNADEAELRREQQAKTGWPAVNRMHELAAFGKGVMVAPELEPLGEWMEAVRVGSELWEEWRFEHQRRGWPWMPDPGKHEWVYFPRGGPPGLRDFEAAVRGEGQSEAAE